MVLKLTGTAVRNIPSDTSGARGGISGTSGKDYCKGVVVSHFKSVQTRISNHCQSFQKFQTMLPLIYRYRTIRD